MALSGSQTTQLVAYAAPGFPRSFIAKAAAAVPVAPPHRTAFVGAEPRSVSIEPEVRSIIVDPDVRTKEPI